MTNGRFTSADVTVVMAVRDREQYVGEAIQSILEQTAPPGAVIVVDDGSQDGTPEVLRGFGSAIQMVRQARANQFVAMNRGVDLATTPLLSFLDSDDRFPPESLAVRVARLNAPDAPDAVFGRTEQFVSPELDAEAASRLRWEAGPLKGELMQAMVLRRPIWERVGPLDDSLRTSANIEWISRARAVGLRTAHVDAVVLERRLHRTNIGITDSEQKRLDLLEVIRRHRRRHTETGDAPEA